MSGLYIEHLNLILVEFRFNVIIKLPFSLRYLKISPESFQYLLNEVDLKITKILDYEKLSGSFNET